MSIIYFSNKIYRCLILEKKTHSALKVKWSSPICVNQNLHLLSIIGFLLLLTIFFLHVIKIELMQCISYTLYIPFLFVFFKYLN